MFLNARRWKMILFTAWANATLRAWPPHAMLPLNSNVIDIRTICEFGQYTILWQSHHCKMLHNPWLNAGGLYARASVLLMNERLKCWRWARATAGATHIARLSSIICNEHKAVMRTHMCWWYMVKSQVSRWVWWWKMIGGDDEQTARNTQ